jgi:hypothetical protein
VRALIPCYDDTLPADADQQIDAWFRNGWSSSEAEIKGDARNAGPTSPSIFVFLPAQSRNKLRSAIIEHKAAQLTLDSRGTPATPEGQDARSATERPAAPDAEERGGACRLARGGRGAHPGQAQRRAGDDLRGSPEACSSCCCGQRLRHLKRFM